MDRLDLKLSSTGNYVYQAVGSLCTHEACSTFQSGYPDGLKYNTNKGGELLLVLLKRLSSYLSRL
jgi:hypothetical protein